jgi:murein DD-endopeptidase MepM/ murein hydrolase activator NlpD
MSAAGLVLIALGWSALVWGGASFLCRLKPSPRAAQAIWRAAAALMFAPFLAALVAPGLPVFEAAPLPDVPVLEPLLVQPAPEGQAAASAALRLPELGVVLMAAIISGWAVRLGLWLVSQVRLQRLKARALRVDRPVAHWADALDLARRPHVCMIPRGAPFLAGIVRPSIFVPAALLASRDASQVLVHELVHLKRGDLVARPLERIVADVFWFSPFAWLVRERLDYWREVVVDEIASEFTGDRIAYARALTRAARLARPAVTLPVAALVLKREGNLKMRLTELLNETPRRPRRLGLAVAGALALAAPLAFAQGMLIKGAPAAASSSVVYAHPVLDKAKLTSTFGSRNHPITGELKFHNGVDLAEEEGKPVYAPAAGTVTRAEFTEGYGNLVEIAAAGGTTLRFGQLQSMNVATGDAVTPGETIAALGQSGKATGPHLHFEVWRAGAPVDPQAEDGLVLAETLRLSAPPAPLAPAGTAAPDAPAPRALLFTGGPSSLAAPVAPKAAPAPKPATAPAAPACGSLSADLAEQKAGPEWAARLEASRAANAANGLALEPDWAPQAVSWPLPVYPSAAMEKGLSGACRVMFDLGADGIPANAVADCSDPVFKSSAAALPGASFKPVLNEAGQAVEVKGVIYPLEYCIE